MSTQWVTPSFKRLKHLPYRGVELSSDLTWSKHINQSVNSANKILGLIKRNFWNCASSARETAYKPLVRPKLEYASGHQQIHKESLQKVQRRAARFVKNDDSRFSSVTDMLKEPNWDTLENRRIKARLVTIYKETHGLIPSNINNLLEDKGKPTTRQSHSLNYKILQARKNSYKYSLYPRTILQWNALPLELKSAPNTAYFKFMLESQQHH
ncbi:hypothetical protein BSL78_14020 [Apostichopus japonicus]|uniref:RNA-directed DNA polymerase from mobile element jockey-like n=1 Tax=Stichopus japonicus TaxID=307972 RepID=A0A2G8KM86_STIJA|nr:hypothetical protein BSL78_14020 [Apostichopus japonicus]